MASRNGRVAAAASASPTDSSTNPPNNDPRLGPMATGTSIQALTQPAVAMPAGGASQRVRGGQTYACSYCGQKFKRSEHKVRHERTHTHEKPYTCRYCHKSYSRKDLVTRHERTLHGHGQVGPSALPAAAAPAEAGGSSPESLASPASSMIRCGPADALRSPSHPANHAPVVSGENQLVHGRRLSQSASTSPGAASAHSNSHHPDFYMSLQGGGGGGGGFGGMYDASPHMPMDVDDHEGYQPQPQRQQQQQLFGQQTQGYHPFPANDAGYLPSFESDMAQYAFSPMSPGALAGLFALDYSQLPNATPTGLPTAALPLTPAVPPPPRHGLPQTPAIPQSNGLPTLPLDPALNQPFRGMRSGHEHSASSGSETLVAPEAPIGDLPLLVKDKPPQIPNLLADDASLHAFVCKDIAERLERPDAFQEVPSSKLLQGFLSGFLECYYRHHPFIHLATLSTTNTPSPLILAMCCIGALYRLDRRRAQRLYTLCTESITPHVRLFIAKSSSEDCPLWVAQTKLLLSAYGALSGDKDMATSVLDENGFYTLLYGKVRLALAAENADMNKMAWDSWVRRESWKRLLVGIYVASTVHVIIWDANPNFNTCRDLELEVLHDETFWNAKTANEWSELRANQPQQDYRTMRDGLASIISETGSKNDGNSPKISIGSPRLSPLTALLLMHAVVVHTWQVVQVAQALSPTTSLSSLGNDPVSSVLMGTAIRSLARCHELLVIAQTDIAGDPGYEEGTSQIFNCQATLRMAYIRLFSSPSNGFFNRPSLITLDDPAAIKSFVSTFSITKQERSPQLLDAVVKAFDGLRIPVRMGHMLVRKTAALRWSPAHAIAGWDCALFVCKWVHSVEMDRLNGIMPSLPEQDLLAAIADVLEEAEYDTGKRKSLAAGVARTWSWLLQDVWVWSITPRMGAVLEQMATAFERVNEASPRPRT